jgi:beta-glucanase (GH16 family)
MRHCSRFCFTGGIIEARVSLPGRTGVTGLWPAFWTLGNLGRAGYGSTLEGMWPYSYDACDSGALPNQTNLKRGDEVWQTSWNAPLSFQPGQKLSACTCSGEE